jgi:hypothetical protein
MFAACSDWPYGQPAEEQGKVSTVSVLHCVSVSFPFPLTRLVQSGFFCLFAVVGLDGGIFLTS